MRVIVFGKDSCNYKEEKTYIENYKCDNGINLFFKDVDTLYDGFDLGIVLGQEAATVLKNRLLPGQMKRCICLYEKGMFLEHVFPNKLLCENITVILRAILDMICKRSFFEIEASEVLNASKDATYCMLSKGEENRIVEEINNHKRENPYARLALLFISGEEFTLSEFERLFQKIVGDSEPIWGYQNEKLDGCRVLTIWKE